MLRGVAVPPGWVGAGPGSVGVAPGSYISAPLVAAGVGWADARRIVRGWGAAPCAPGQCRRICRSAWASASTRTCGILRLSPSVPPCHFSDDAFLPDAPGKASGEGDPARELGFEWADEIDYAAGACLSTASTERPTTHRGRAPCVNIWEPPLAADYRLDTSTSPVRISATDGGITL